MRSCLLRLAALAALIIPLPAAAFNFAPSEPKPVPELAFFDGTGNQVSLADFRGEVVVLNLWATWCAPCRHEMPSLDRLQARFGGNGLEVIALSLDRGDIAKAREFFEELGISSLALYHDPEGRAGRELGAPGLPTTVVIDRSGQEVGRLLGPAEWDSDEAIAVIEALLGRPAAPAAPANGPPKHVSTKLTAVNRSPVIAAGRQSSSQPYARRDRRPASS